MVRDDITILSVAVINFNQGLRDEGIRGLRRLYRLTKRSDIRLLVEDLTHTFRCRNEVLSSQTATVSRSGTDLNLGVQS